MIDKYLSNVFNNLKNLLIIYRYKQYYLTMRLKQSIQMIR